MNPQTAERTHRVILGLLAGVATVVGALSIHDLVEGPIWLGVVYGVLSIGLALGVMSKRAGAAGRRR
jgi:hypothetical protein